MTIGDFDGKTGERNDIDEFLGTFLGKEIRNKNAHCYFLHPTQPRISNTHFQHKYKRMVTWKQSKYYEIELKKEANP